MYENLNIGDEIVITETKEGTGWGRFPDEYLGKRFVIKELHVNDQDAEIFGKHATIQGDWQIFENMVNWNEVNPQLVKISHQYGSVTFNKFKSDKLLEIVKNVNHDIEIWMQNNTCVKYDNGNMLIKEFTIEEVDQYSESTGDNTILEIFEMEDFENYI